MHTLPFKFTQFSKNREKNQGQFHKSLKAKSNANLSILTSITWRKLNYYWPIIIANIYWQLIMHQALCLSTLYMLILIIVQWKGATIISILQKRKPRHGEVYVPVRSYSWWVAEPGCQTRALKFQIPWLCQHPPANDHQECPVVKQVGLITHCREEFTAWGNVGISIRGYLRGLTEDFGLMFGDLGEG